MRHDFTDGPDEYTIAVADSPTGKNARRGVTLFRRGSAQPVGKAFLYQPKGERTRYEIQSLRVHKGTLERGLIEAGALPRPPPPKPVVIPRPPPAQLTPPDDTAAKAPAPKRRRTPKE